MEILFKCGLGVRVFCGSLSKSETGDDVGCRVDNYDVSEGD